MRFSPWLFNILLLGHACFWPLSALGKAIEPLDEVNDLSQRYFAGNLSADPLQTQIADLLSSHPDLEQPIHQLFAHHFNKYQLHLSKRLAHYNSPTDFDVKIYQELLQMPLAQVLPLLQALLPHLQYLAYRGIYLHYKGWGFAPWAKLWPEDLAKDPELVRVLSLFFPPAFIALITDPNRRTPFLLDEWLHTDEPYLLAPPPQFGGSTRIFSKPAWVKEQQQILQRCSQLIERQIAVAEQQDDYMTQFCSAAEDQLNQCEQNLDVQFEAQINRLADMGLDLVAQASQGDWADIKAYQQGQKKLGEKKLNLLILAPIVAAGTTAIIIFTAPVSLPALTIGGTTFSAQQIFFGVTTAALVIGSGLAVAQAIGDAQFTEAGFANSLIEHWLDNSTQTLLWTPLFAGIALAPTAVSRVATQLWGPQTALSAVGYTQQAINLLSLSAGAYSAVNSFENVQSAKEFYLQAQGRELDESEREQLYHQSWQAASRAAVQALYAFIFAKSAMRLKPKPLPQTPSPQPETIDFSPTTFTPSALSQRGWQAPANVSARNGTATLSPPRTTSRQSVLQQTPLAQAPQTSSATTSSTAASSNASSSTAVGIVLVGETLPLNNSVTPSPDEEAQTQKKLEEHYAHEDLCQRLGASFRSRFPDAESWVRAGRPFDNPRSARSTPVRKRGRFEVEPHRYTPRSPHSYTKWSRESITKGIRLLSKANILLNADNVLNKQAAACNKVLQATFGADVTINGFYQAAERIFGNWDNALKVAGFDPKSVRRNFKWNPERVIEGLKALKRARINLRHSNILRQKESEVNHILQTHFEYPSMNRRIFYAAIIYHFKTWEAALLAAGISY